MTARESIATLRDLARRFPHRPIYIAETAYPSRGKAPRGHDFPATPLGQLQYLRSVLGQMSWVLPADQRGGVLWWELNETCDSALFSPDHVAGPALLYGFSRASPDIDEPSSPWEALRGKRQGAKAAVSWASGTGRGAVTVR
eukprot:1547935-Prymnesium_polylepis.2